MPTSQLDEFVWAIVAHPGTDENVGVSCERRHCASSSQELEVAQRAGLLGARFAIV